MKKTIILTLLILLFAAQLASCSGGKTAEGSDVPFGTEPMTEPAAEDPAEPIAACEKRAGDPFGYCDLITDEERGLYYRILDSIEAGNFTFTLDFNYYSGDREALSKCVYLCIYDHPEFFTLNGNTNYRWNYDKDTGEGTVTVELGTIDPPPGESYDSMTAELERAIGEIVGAARNLPDDFEKTLYVHDAIINGASYGASSDGFSHSAYGCLSDGRCVCEGYSKAFKMAADRLGIDSLYVSGEAVNSRGQNEGHAWNLVKIGDDFCQIDLTWDDRGIAGPGGNEARYDYFCLTDDEMYNDHTPEEKYCSLPACTELTYNYHYHRGLYLENYSFEEVKDLFDSGASTVKFADEEEFEAAKAELFGDGLIFRIDPFREKTIVYYTEHRIITVFTEE